ncbi:CRISPR-associated protein Cas4 [Candidatus Woesearchaeota archaeon]|nr:CRISPR-associated protein Cas4 [Candidatus Woesearchaeota archaeon]
MLSVTDLTSYMYCSRKLYFNKVLGVREKASVVGIKGTIKHAVFEDAGREDKDVLCSFLEKDSLESLEMKYRSVYYKVLMFHIQRMKKELEFQGLKTVVVYQELWPFFLKEAQEKSSHFFALGKEKNLYGETLWLALPKSVPELRIVSEKLQLIGVIDRVDLVDGFIPIEIKTGSAPKEGVWKENMIQLGAYMLLLSEHYGKEITEGYIEYRAISERRKVFMNPFLKDEIFELLGKVRETLRSKDLPEKTKDVRKCEGCGIREICYNQP